MKVSVILIATSREQCAEALQALDSIEYPADQIEVILALGKNPSAQRNEAAEKARGDFLLFLDDDSLAHPRLLHYYLDALSYESGIGIVGGPALHRAGATSLQQAVAEVLSSPMALGPFHARYAASGLVRATSERELILCNLLVRRELFLSEGGFNPQLYPNEENEFLNRVQSKTKIYFHPLAACFRHAPSTLPEFTRKMFRYGAGRAKHMYLFPRFRDKIFLIPSVFTLLVGAAPLLLLHRASLYLLALILLPYLSIGLFASLYPAVTRKRPGLLLQVPALFFACHLAYGLGLLWSLVRQPFLRQRALPPVRVAWERKFGEQRASAPAPR